MHSSPHGNIEKASELVDNKHNIKEEKKLEEIIEEDIRQSVEKESIVHMSPNALNKSKANGFEESDGDGLINWALNLPDELSGSHTSQFYKNKN